MEQSGLRRVGAHPRLYDAASQVPILLGVECTRCERVYFPPLDIGCESCGATELTPTTLAATGIVFAVATLHQHPGNPPAPFTIAEVLLDAGPLIRAMVHPDAGDLEIGARVAGRWLVTESEDQTQTVEPAFVLAQSGQER
ncbi:zinc ribbon domain-containing protein [Mycobacterium sp. pUA109]|uniref:zinc ribbon domain-containing protein n=1 Tax=Mycobacterium sp. pUA109 TaxID=3238982 RepID=UPI00351BC543